MSKRVFVVTGGSSGIGLAVIKKLTSDPSHHVFSFSRSKEKIERAMLDLEKIPENLEFIEGDVCNEADCQRFYEKLKENHRFIHGLVNAAGVLTKGGIENITYSQWKYNLEVNLNGPYIFTQSLLPMLKAVKGASIVNVSSIASMRPGRSVAYSVSKAGLDMLTEYLAGELAPYKIRVNSVNPGFIKTNIHIDNQIVTTSNEYKTLVSETASKIPLGRAGEANDVADLILFLLNDKSSWITGSIFKIDGGTLIENDFLPIQKKS